MVASMLRRATNSTEIANARASATPPQTCQLTPSARPQRNLLRRRRPIDRKSSFDSLRYRAQLRCVVVRGMNSAIPLDQHEAEIAVDDAHVSTIPLVANCSLNGRDINNCALFGSPTPGHWRAESPLACRESGKLQSLRDSKHFGSRDKSHRSPHCCPGAPQRPRSRPANTF